MSQDAFPAANPAPRPLLTRAMTIGISLAPAANGTSSARADSSRLPPSTQRYDDATSPDDTALRRRLRPARRAGGQGHAPAALRALAMGRYRPSVAGGEWSATPPQLRRWSSLALHEGAGGSLITEYDGGE
jgi:hypothetical protein